MTAPIANYLISTLPSVWQTVKEYAIDVRAIVVKGKTVKRISFDMPKEQGFKVVVEQHYKIGSAFDFQAKAVSHYTGEELFLGYGRTCEDALTDLLEKLTSYFEDGQ